MWTGRFFSFLSSVGGSRSHVCPCAVRLAGQEPEEVRCHGAELVLGVLVPGVLPAGRLHWHSRAADFASSVLQLLWKDVVHKEKLNECGVKQRAKSKD